MQSSHPSAVAALHRLLQLSDGLRVVNASYEDEGGVESRDRMEKASVELQLRIPDSLLLPPSNPPSTRLLKRSRSRRRRAPRCSPTLSGRRAALWSWRTSVSARFGCPDEQCRRLALSTSSEWRVAQPYSLHLVEACRTWLETMGR
jgi:hypothetical protein